MLGIFKQGVQVVLSGGYLIHIAGNGGIAGFCDNCRPARGSLLEYRQPVGHVILPHIVSATGIDMGVAIGDEGREIAKLRGAGNNTRYSV